MDQLDRPGERSNGPPGRCPGRGHRHTRRQVDGAPPRDRSGEGGRCPRERRRVRLSRGQGGQVVDPRGCRLRRVDARGRDREGSEDTAAGAVRAAQERGKRGLVGARRPRASGSSANAALQRSGRLWSLRYVHTRGRPRPFWDPTHPGTKGGPGRLRVPAWPRVRFRLRGRLPQRRPRRA